MISTNKVRDEQIKRTSSRVSMKSVVETASTCGNHTRLVIAIQSALFMASLMGNVICWNAAIVKVSELETSPLYPAYKNGTTVDWTDDSLPMSKKRIPLTQLQISLLFASTFAGALVGVVPVTMLMERCGSYRVMLINGAISCLATALTPHFAVTNFYALLGLRVLIGVAQCQLYPVIGSIVKSWAPLHERSVFVSVLTGYSQLSAVITTSASSWLAKNYSWPSIFYAQSVFCGFCLLFWVLNFRDNPAKHPLVSPKEFNRISHGKQQQQPSAGRRHGLQVPFYRLIQFPCVIAPCLAMAVYILIIQLNIAFLVMFLVWVMKLDINLAGGVATISLVTQLCIQVITGMLSDRIKFISEIWKIRIFNSIAFYCTAVGLIAATFFDDFEQSGTCVTILVVSLCTLGFNSGGFPRSAVMISTQCPASVMGCLQTAMTIALFFGSFIVPGLTPHRTFDEYAFLFRLYGALLIVANTFFVVFAKATSQTFVPPPHITIAVTSETSMSQQDNDESIPKSPSSVKTSSIESDHSIDNREPRKGILKSEDLFGENNNNDSEADKESQRHVNIDESSNKTENQPV